MGPKKSLIELTKPRNLSDIESSIDRFRSIKHTVTVSKDIVIIDMNLFISSHISYLRANKGNLAYMPYFERLSVVLDYLETNESHIQ